MKVIGQYFFPPFLITSSGFGIREWGLREWAEKYSLFFNFLEEFLQNWDYVFLKCMVEFTSEAIWDWFSLWNVLQLLFILKYYRMTRVVCFFFSELQ